MNNEWEQRQTCQPQPNIQLASHIPDKCTFFRSRYRGEPLLRKGRPSPSRAGKQTSSFLCQLCWQFISNTRHFATFAAKVAARINYLDNSSPVCGWFPALHFPTSSVCLCILFHSSSLFSPPPSSPPPPWGKSARWGAPHRKKWPPGDIWRWPPWLGRDQLRQSSSWIF